MLGEARAAVEGGSRLTCGGYFNDGVPVYSIVDPSRLVELGYVIPKAPAGNAMHTFQLNDVYEHGLIYTNDRFTGGSTSSNTPGPRR